MKTPKNFVGALGVALLPVMLFSFGILFSAYQILGSPTPVKQALDESGIYEAAIGSALKRSSAEVGASATSSLPLQDPGVQQAIEKAIPPDYLQSKSEGALDSVYRWLQGDTSSLQFSINVEDAKGKLADELAAYTQQRTTTLPVCENDQDLTAVTNPLNATCVPAQFDPAAAGQTVKNEILSNQDFLPNSELAANDITNDQGQPLDQQLKVVPAVYEQVVLGTIITGALGVLCIAAILLLSGDLRSGLKRLGWSALPVGIITVLLAWGAGFALTKLTTALTQEGSDALQASIVNAVTLLTQNMRHWWLAYGLVIIAIGLVSFVLSRTLRPKITHSLAPATATATTPGMAPLNPVTDEEARHATEIAPTPPSAPARPAGQRKFRKVQ